MTDVLNRRDHTDMQAERTLEFAATPTALTPEKIHEISEEIRNKEPGMEAPCALEDYLAYQRLEGSSEERDAHLQGMYNKVKLVADSLVGHVPEDEIAKAYNESCLFIYKAVCEYIGYEKPQSKTSFVFAVPTRVMRNFNPFSFNGADYRSEVVPFLPIAQYVDAGITQKLSVGLPPSVIEDYTADEQGKKGKLLFVPVFGDMAFDLMQDEDDGDFRKGLLRSRKAAEVIMNDAARFVRDKLGAADMGLGAILASLTKFGTTIDQDGEPRWVREDPKNPYNGNWQQVRDHLETTTGHGGTVHLIMETIAKVMDEADIEVGDSIGVIGAAGSIGSAAVASLLERFDKKVVMADKPDRRSALEKMQVKYGEDKTEIVGDLLGVIEKTNIIASAITERIDLDLIDPGGKLDLTGKVFIDDSQPGCFDRAQIEERGGHLLWVVGHDPKGRVSRVHGYTFGSEEGLMGDSNWGCELEAWLIAKTGRRDLALRGPVTPEKVKAIGEEMEREGIKAGPFQSFGRRVDLPNKKRQTLAA